MGLHANETNSPTDSTLKNIHVIGYVVADAAARVAVTTMVDGDALYQQDTMELYIYDGTTLAWVVVGGGGGITLAGDVTGPSGSNTVAKINGATLGSTTATSANILVANGTQWVSVAVSGDVTITNAGVASVKANLSKASFGITIDGGGVTPTTGSKGYTVIPYNGTITDWYIIGDASGSAVVDLKRSGTSIVGGSGNKPTLTSAQRANAAVASWTSTSITANDEIEFNLDSASTLTRINLIIEITKS